MINANYTALVARRSAMHVARPVAPPGARPVNRLVSQL